jgi:hypothetical protein
VTKPPRDRYTWLDTPTTWDSVRALAILATVGPVAKVSCDVTVGTALSRHHDAVAAAWIWPVWAAVAVSVIGGALFNRAAMRMAVRLPSARLRPPGRLYLAPRHAGRRHDPPARLIPVMWPPVPRDHPSRPFWRGLGALRHINALAVVVLAYFSAQTHPGRAPGSDHRSALYWYLFAETGIIDLTFRLLTFRGLRRWRRAARRALRQGRQPTFDDSSAPTSGAFASESSGSSPLSGS